MPVPFINIISTLFIVIFALIVYRQLDKNNRSIDKVKRYTDIVKNNLESFIDEKSTEIKDLAIELEVNLKTGKEVLKRIETMSLTFKDKSKEIDDIHTKIKEYDYSMNKLIDMTDRVDENLNRIQRESVYIDRVGKKLKDYSVQINKIEKNIPAIQDQFNKSNKVELEKIEFDIRNSVEERINTISDEIKQSEQRIKNYSAYITRLEGRRDNMEQETVNRLKKISDSIIIKAKETSMRLLSELTTKFKTIIEESKEEKSVLFTFMNDFIGSSKQKIMDIEAGFEKRLGEFENDLASIESNYKKRLESAAVRGEELEHEAFINLKELIEGRARNLQKDIELKYQKLSDELSTRRKEVIELFGRTRSDLAVLQAENTKKIKEADIIFNDSLTTIKDGINGHLNTMRGIWIL